MRRKETSDENPGDHRRSQWRGADPLGRAPTPGGVHYLWGVLGLTGTHVGCETSLCGASTGLIDGQPVKSCAQRAVLAEVACVTTIEGMATDGELHPLQQAFWDEPGLQCGYCTPGMIMAAADLLGESPERSARADTRRLALPGDEYPALPFPGFRGGAPRGAGGGDFYRGGGSGRPAAPRGSAG
jgi:aerobic-type carbon monoxide dehydrogenase small subunit (CoxS/CutS family)